jgi:hypothetical protein
VSAPAVNAALIAADACLDQEGLKMLVGHADIIGHGRVKSCTVAERQLSISGQYFFQILRPCHECFPLAMIIASLYRTYVCASTIKAKTAAANYPV